MRIYIILLLTTALAACGNGYFFKTKATYLLEESNLTVNLIAKGHVLDGDDTTDNGFVYGTITGSKLLDTIYFKANATTFSYLKYKEKEFINQDITQNLLAPFLDTLKQTSYNKQEVIEIEKVIKVAAYGPKTTYVKGQTNFIKVVDVSFKTNRANNDE